jgi:hypothetical protein
MPITNIRLILHLVRAQRNAALGGALVKYRLSVILVLQMSAFCFCTSAFGQCASGCSDTNCACCDCNGNCLLDSSGGCCGVSPIVIDVSREGFRFTNADNGVDFDFFATGKKVRISWTASGSHNAWLVLDRNNNGRIDDGTEMFGNISPQPKSDHPNGFLALAVYDLPENGGNGDGIIDSRDKIYSSLRLWIDANHNGISEPDELFALHEFDVVSIDLSYTLSDRVDEFGNHFRYKSTIIDSLNSADRIIYDVFLVLGHPPASLAEASASGTLLRAWSNRLEPYAYTVTGPFGANGLLVFAGWVLQGKHELARPLTAVQSPPLRSQ